MISDYTWYNIFNLDDFEALGLVSKLYTVVLTDVGQREILVTKGNYVSVYFDEVFLSINMNGDNPFYFESRAVAVDADNDVFIGILNED